LPDPRLLPYSIRVLLDTVLRHEDGLSVTRAVIEAVSRWDSLGESITEMAFRPARACLPT
jgi:aconitate hydratase